MLILGIAVGMCLSLLVRTTTSYAATGGSRTVPDIAVDYTADAKRQEAYERAFKIASIGTDREEEVLGYSITRVMQVITAENRFDKYNCYGAAQCLYNACELAGWKVQPDKMCEVKNYTDPLTWVSDEAYRAVVDIFINGKTFDIVENATMFYNPAICGTSQDHEVQRFVVEINGIRYFEETVGASQSNQETPLNNNRKVAI